MKLRSFAACVGLGVVAIAGLCQAAEPTPSGSDAQVAAEWRVHQTMFTYTGMTSIYSCDGLESKLKLLLRLAGARPDMKVRATCSSPSGGPSRLASARLTFATLAESGAAPLPQDSAAAKTPPAPAPEPAMGAWRRVALATRKPFDLDAGDCELVEQFERDLLPYFTTRAKESHLRCVPHQVSFAGIDLKFEVLAPPVPPKK
jgi:hypothetical protein